jgi:hypothetical protein
LINFVYKTLGLRLAANQNVLGGKFKTAILLSAIVSLHVLLADEPLQPLHEAYIKYRADQVAANPSIEKTKSAAKLEALGRDYNIFEKYKALPVESEQFLNSSIEFQIRANQLYSQALLSPTPSNDWINEAERKKFIEDAKKTSISDAARPFVYRQMAKEPDARDKIISEVYERRSNEMNEAFSSSVENGLRRLGSWGLPIVNLNSKSNLKGLNVIAGPAGFLLDLYDEHRKEGAEKNLKLQFQDRLPHLAGGISTAFSHPRFKTVAGDDLKNLEISENLPSFDQSYFEKNQADFIRQLGTVKKEDLKKVFDNIGDIVADAKKDLENRQENENRERKLSQARINGAYDSINAASTALNLAGQPEKAKAVATIGKSALDIANGAENLQVLFLWSFSS